MSEALRSAIDPKNIEALQAELKEVLRLQSKSRNPNAQTELPDFEVFRTRLAEKKREVAEIYLKASENGLTNQEKVDFLRKLDIMDKKVVNEISTL